MHIKVGILPTKMPSRNSTWHLVF